jgi:hypothetical protein
MNRKIPVWAFLFVLLCGLLFCVVLAWAVQSTMAGSGRSGAFGRVAVEIGRFPSTVVSVFSEIGGRVTGEFEDEHSSTGREKSPDQPGFRELSAPEGSTLAGLFLRAGDAAQSGYRLLNGTFRLNDQPQHAAILLSPDNEIVHIWRLIDRPVDGEELKRPAHRIFPHGIELLPDGSLIYTFDGNDTIQRISACGDPIWVTGGGYHHAVTLAESQETVWSLRKQGMVELSVADGKVLRHTSMDELAELNPDIDIFGQRRHERTEKNPNERNQPTKALTDPIHLNDIDPLPTALASAYPMFEAGDLVLSARSLNTIFVVNPDTNEIKWWRSGAVRRQHDPEWTANGEFLVYDNRMGLDHTRIVAIDPASFQTRLVLEGSDIDFFSRIRGKLQWRADGSLVITSPQQGYAFETTPDGDVVFEIVSTKPDSVDENYIVSELKWYPPDSFDTGTWTCTTTN